MPYRQICVMIHIYVYIYMYIYIYIHIQDWESDKAPAHISVLSGYRARAPIFPAKKGALHKMDAGTQQKWKDGIGNLLDLSAWYDPSKKVDLRVEDNAKPAIEDIELDTVMGTTDINLLSATSLVAWVGIWLNWHNPGNTLPTALPAFTRSLVSFRGFQGTNLSVCPRLASPRSLQKGCSLGIFDPGMERNDQIEKDARSRTTLLVS